MVDSSRLLECKEVLKIGFLGAVWVIWMEGEDGLATVSLEEGSEKLKFTLTSSTTCTWLSQAPRGSLLSYIMGPIFSKGVEQVDKICVLEQDRDFKRECSLKL